MATRKPLVLISGVQNELPAGDTVTGGGALNVIAVSGTTQAAAVNTRYICQNVALTTITLPATANVGDIIEIDGHSAGLWKLAQNAGQQIDYRGTNTTIGVTGYLTSTINDDFVQVICATNNTNWLLIRGSSGVRDQNGNSAGSSIVTTKGDLDIFSTIETRLPVGADGTVLAADSTQSAGLKYKTPALTVTPSTYTGAGQLYSVKNDDVVDTLIAATSAPGSPQYTYTVLSGDIPTAPIDFSDLVTFGGKNTDAGASRTVNYIVTRNGVDMMVGSALVVAASQFWYAMVRVASVNVVAGDVIGLKLWGSVTNVLDYRYVNHYFFPRKIHDNTKTWVGMITNYTSSAQIIKGAIAGVTYTSYGTATNTAITDAGSANIATGTTSVIVPILGGLNAWGYVGGVLNNVDGRINDGTNAASTLWQLSNYFSTLQVTNFSLSLT